MISYEGDNDVGGTWGVYIWQKGYSPLAYCVNPTWYAGELFLKKLKIQMILQKYCIDSDSGK